MRRGPSDQCNWRYQRDIRGRDVYRRRARDRMKQGLRPGAMLKYYQLAQPFPLDSCTFGNFSTLPIACLERSLHCALQISIIYGGSLIAIQRTWYNGPRASGVLSG